MSECSQASRMRKRSVACKIRFFQYPIPYSFQGFFFFTTTFFLSFWACLGSSFVLVGELEVEWGLVPSSIRDMACFGNGVSKLLFLREMVFLGHVERYKLDHRVINASQGFQFHPTSSIFLLLRATD